VYIKGLGAFILDEVEGVSNSAEASTNFWPTTLISETEKD